MTKDIPEIQRRKYIRLDSVLPVQFRFLSSEKSAVLCELQQGFTNNIGKGGICLKINNLNPEQSKFLISPEIKIYLEIEGPFSRHPVGATARISWIRKFADAPNKFLLGLVYEDIDSVSSSRLMQYVWAKKLILPVIFSLVFFLGLGLGFNTYLNMKLSKGNKVLIEQLVKILQETSIAKQKIKEISMNKADFESKIQALQSRIQAVETEKTELKEGVRTQEERSAKKEAEFNQLISRLSQEKTSLQEKLLGLQHKESIVTEELLRLDKSKAVLAQANFDKMFQWLLVHQNQRSGLVMSYEGDDSMANCAFTYDQSLVIQAYSNFSDFERARKIMDFFARKAKKREGLFLNAYYAIDGSPVEYIVHSGPNIWLGIAIVQYTKKANDKRYLGLAEEIAQAIINLQNQDAEGGIRGGPGINWFSTEHNLDAYAFFNMLYKITNNRKYTEAADKVLSWLVKNIYNNHDIPIIRGKGDSTIATDTYAWSIAAIGPTKLEELQMSPDKVIDFAEENCAVNVSFTRPEGTIVKIKGFDFAPQRHLARGGVVSSEWTAQMILAFKIISEYYHNNGQIAKARTYELKADAYLVDLCNMIISSPSPYGQGEGCLPYASLDSVDTGHGWATPKGKFTGSVSGTAYTLFAYYNFNPLELKD